MRRLLLTYALICGALFAASPCFAQVPMTGAGLGKPASAPSYTGPGDVVAFAHWYGLRAYNAAYAAAGNPILDISTNSGTLTTTINSLSNGSLDVAAVASWLSTNSQATAYVAKLYDQPNYGGSPYDLIYSTYPALSTSPVGIVGNGSSGYVYNNTSTNFTTIPQPFALVAIAQKTGGPEVGGIISGGDGLQLLGFGTTDGEVFITGTTGGSKTYHIATQSVSDNVLHSFQGIFNDAQASGGAGSFVAVDGVAGSAITNVGTDGLLYGIGIIYDSTLVYLNGYWCEGGVISGAFATNSALQTNMANAISTYY